MPAGWTAAAIAGAGALSAGSSLVGSGKASSGAKNAAQLQMDMFNRTQGNLAPFVGAGANMLGPLQNIATGSPTGGGPNYIAQAAGAQPGTLTQAQLEMMPGYRFIQQQGLQSVASSNAARGLGVSGAEMKGAANYSTGLANQTYMNAFQQQQQQFANLLNLNTAQQQNLQNQYSRLAGVAELGENAAAGTGQIGATLAGSAGGFLNQAGLANAAGATGVGSAATGAVNNYLGYNALQQFLQNQRGTLGMGDPQAPTGTFSNYQPPSMA